MIEQIGGLLNWLASVVNTSNPVGLAAIFLLPVLADIGIPVPFVIEPALFLVTYKAGPLSVPVLIFLLVMTGGRQVGSGILYWLSRLWGKRLSGRICRRLPRFTQQFNQQAEQFTARLGNRWTQATVLARLTPGLLQVSSITAGTLRLPYTVVFVAVTISGLLRDVIIVFLAYLSQIGLKSMHPEMATWIALSLAILLGLVSFFINLVRKRLDTARKLPPETIGKVTALAAAEHQQ